MITLPLVSKKQRFKLSTLFLVGVALATLNSASDAQPADAQPAMEWTDFKNDAALAKKVNLECARLGLDSFVKEAGEKTGVQLVLAEGSGLNTRKVTARIKDMSLSDFMLALARTYVAEWRKSETGAYTLHPQTTDEGAVGAAQIGTGLFYQYRDRIQPGSGEINQRRGTLYQRIVAELGLGKLQARGGIPFSSLSLDAAAAVRSEYELEYVSRLLRSYIFYKDALSPDAVIRLKMKRNTAGAGAPKNPGAMFLGQEDTMALEILNKQKNRIDPSMPLVWDVYRARAELPED